MSILGVVLRVQPEGLPDVRGRLATLPGVDTVVDDGQGRLVLVIEDTDTVAPADATPPPTAAATLGAIAMWPECLSTALVYEYSGPEAPAPDGPVPAYQAWRDALGTSARARS